MVEGKQTTPESEILTEAFNEMAAGLRERERVKDTFGKYMTREVADYLLKGKIKLGGEIRELSILIARIPSYPKLIEGKSPEDILSFLAPYHEKVIPAISTNHGRVDKFYDDAVLATFGAPIPREEHRMDAVTAALAIQKAMKAAQLPITLTVNSGEALIGNIGTEDRLEFTVVGNLLTNTRLMAEAQQRRPNTIIVGSQTYEGISDLALAIPTSLIGRFKDRFRIVYQLTGLKQPAISS